MQLCYFKHNKFVSFGMVPKSTINFCELTLLLHGSLEYAINKKTVVLKSGDSMRPKTLRASEKPLKIPTTSASISIPPPTTSPSPCRYILSTA